MKWHLFKNKVEKERIERENQNRQDLKNILKIANEIISKTTTYEGTHPVYLLVKQLIDQELYKNIYSSISTFDPNKVEYFTESDLLPRYSVETKSKEPYLYINDFGKFITYKEFFEQSKVKDKKIPIKLGYDPVLTRLWNVNRLVRAYSNIGKGKPKGNWIEDSNHTAELWLPFGITFVNSGNHSITTGILNNEGIIEISDIHDAGCLLNNIYCDGVNYFRKKDHSLYAPVANFSLAVVFEIGRLINKYKFEKQIKFKNFYT